MEKLFQLILVVSIVTFCKCNFTFVPFRLELTLNRPQLDRLFNGNQIKNDFSDFDCAHGGLHELYKTTRNNEKWCIEWNER